MKSGYLFLIIMAGIVLAPACKKEQKIVPKKTGRIQMEGSQGAAAGSGWDYYGGVEEQKSFEPLPNGDHLEDVFRDQPPPPAPRLRPAPRSHAFEVASAAAAAGPAPVEADSRALFVAIDRGRFNDVYDILEANPGLINSRNFFRETPLITASNKGKNDIVKYLRDFPGVDINAQTPYGQTALIRACLRRHGDVVGSLLLHPRIDIHISDDIGHTALKWARIRHSQNIIRLLVDAEVRERR